MSTFSYREGSWVEPASRRRFSYRCWRPATTRALLVIIHGFGEHGGRYHSFAQALAEHGICVAAPDLWGHGRSGGRRGDVEQVADCAQHLWEMTKEVFLPESGKARYALFGHSFGGLVGILWALNNPQDLQRAVIQSPLLEVGFPVPRWKTTAACSLAKWWPAFSFLMNLDVGALSHDPGVVQAYQADSLVHNFMSARTYRSILHARADALERAPALRVPVLLLCGAEDRIISVETAQRWFDRLTCTKRSVVFPGCYHELHHEAVRDDVLRLVHEWTLTEEQGA